MTLESELAAPHGPLLRFAPLQLRNNSMADDVVSKAMPAILEKPDNLEGRSPLHTCATGILKFKIIDVLRRVEHEVHNESLDEQCLHDALDALFLQDGHWREPPPAWQQPARAEATPVLRSASGLREPSAAQDRPRLHGA